MAFLFSVEMGTYIATEDFITVSLKIISTCSKSYLLVLHILIKNIKIQYTTNWGMQNK